MILWLNASVAPLEDLRLFPGPIMGGSELPVIYLQLERIWHLLAPWVPELTHAHTPTPPIHTHTEAAASSRPHKCPLYHLNCLPLTKDTELWAPGLCFPDVLESPLAQGVGTGPGSILPQGSTTVFNGQMPILDLKILINMIMCDKSYSHFLGARRNKHTNYTRRHTDVGTVGQVVFDTAWGFKRLTLKIPALPTCSCSYQVMVSSKDSLVWFVCLILCCARFHTW